MARAGLPARARHGADPLAAEGAAQAARAGARRRRRRCSGGSSPAASRCSTRSRASSRALRGVRVPRSAWDLSRLPPHLRMTFLVEDEHGRPIAEGNDLAALREEVAPRLRAELTERDPELERTGARSWDSARCRARSTCAAGGVRAYPALVDEGETVGVRVLETPRGAGRGDGGRHAPAAAAHGPVAASRGARPAAAQRAARAGRRAARQRPRGARGRADGGDRRPRRARRRPGPGRGRLPAPARPRRGRAPRRDDAVVEQIAADPRRRARRPAPSRAADRRGGRAGAARRRGAAAAARRARLRHGERRRAPRRRRALPAGGGAPPRAPARQPGARPRPHARRSTSSRRSTGAASTSGRRGGRCPPRCARCRGCSRSFASASSRRASARAGRCRASGSAG